MSEQALAVLLAMAGLAVNADEAQALTGAFVESRQAVDALYRVPEVRYEVPALTWSSTLVREG